MFQSSKKLLAILISSLFIIVHSGFIGTAGALANRLTVTNANSPTVILVSDFAMLNDVGQLIEKTKVGSLNKIKGSQAFLDEQVQHLMEKEAEMADHLSAEAKALLSRANISQIISNIGTSIEENLTLSKKSMQDLSDFVASSQFIEASKNVLEQQNIAKDRVLEETNQLLKAKAELGLQILKNTQTTMGDTLISSKQILEDASKVTGDKLQYSQMLVQDFGNNIKTMNFSDISAKTQSLVDNINIPVNQLILDSISFAGEQLLGGNKQLQKDMKIFMESTPETMCQAYLDMSQGVDSLPWKTIQKGGSATFTLFRSITAASAAGAGALSGYAGIASTVSQLGLGGLTQLVAGWLGSSATGAAATAVVTSAVGGPLVMGTLLVGGTGAFAYGSYRFGQLIAGQLDDWAKTNCK
ncbi:hypothetical protein PCC9214_02690 [Planktothrix tepida]|uniref:Uncharacterized protein n=1 Tax=Planktothrix tepida PCC 9214 TaxID=671072 RepID=A0A1J1LL34_9CYAN|nr:hypothetical protein [Planktothrix tepida]CAD5953204.1 hypothetical protein PCC9214_02690 [Planktothrix tepida]CUR32738.1 membrane hypothetical protein [Planktothrix tepida PCC 9214]